jgi:opacity protein-like surface antigen
MKKIMRVMLALASFLASSSASGREYKESSAYVEGRSGGYYSSSDVYLYMAQPDMQPETVRAKVFYISGHAGYMSPKSFRIEDASGCTNSIEGLFCDSAKNPLDSKIGLPDRLFVTAGIGFNTSTAFRFDAEWFRVHKNMEAKGDWTAFLTSTSKLETIDASSKIGIEGATVNMYLDLVSDRARPEWLVVPYVMGGIGRSTVKLDDMTITRTDGAVFTIAGRDQKTTASVLGAGFTIGINSYIAFDFGYRFYDFGNVSPAKKIQTGAYTIPADTEFELKAHIATLGLRLQI